jgi:hypothetical protein
MSAVDNNTLKNSNTATVTAYTTYRLLNHKQVGMCGVVMQAINQALN